MSISVRRLWEMVAKQPPGADQNEGRYDVVATVRGGGVTGQAGAIRLGVGQSFTES